MLTKIRPRLLLVLLFLVAASCSHEDNAVEGAVVPPGPTLARIAHAGGGMGQRVYNNSREAIEHNLARGFTWFELDFLWTSDNQLVTFHDWNLQARRDFGFVPEQVPDLATFQQWVQAHASQQHMSLTELAQLMNEHPQLVLVTDVKARNIEALRQIAATLPDSDRRVVPQIYQPEQYQAVRQLGFRQMIWTLYQYPGDDASVLAELKNMQLLAVTMPVERAESGLALKLTQADVASYAHTVNEPQQLRQLQSDWGISEIYTDFIAPVPD